MGYNDNLFSKDFFNSEWNKGYNRINFLPNFQNTFSTKTMTDYASLFSRNANKALGNFGFEMGKAFTDSPFENTRNFGNQIVNQSFNDASLTTDFSLSNSQQSSNTGFNALQAGMDIGNQVASQLGGKTGKLIGDATKLGGAIGSTFTNVFENGLFGSGKVGTDLSKAANGASIAGMAFDLLGNFLPNKSEYNGPKGDITQTVDSSYDALSNLAFAFGPIGAIVGSSMKGASFLGKGLNALGGGTDGMTAQDAILGSSLINLTPIGMINGFGGKRSHSITKDQNTFAMAGSSYTGTLQLVDSALEKSNKKYGAFSTGARHSANRLIDKANLQQDVLSDITNEAEDRFNIINSMLGYNNIKRQRYLNGGYNQANVQIGKLGMKIEPSNEYTIIKEFKEGGSFNNSTYIKEVIDPTIIKEIVDPTFIKEVDEFVDKFKEGGSFNVIPEGALHARLHHMENDENITKKGIPVVSENENGKILLQAEIEKEEIIFRLSVTKKLEQLAKENTDESAIEAGKLIVDEIFNNTIDNTNNLI